MSVSCLSRKCSAGLWLKMMAGVLCFSSALVSCGHPTGQLARNQDSAAIPELEFSADSAFAYVQAQVDMGPRVPGTETHRLCADFLVSELARMGADTVRQRAVVYRYDGKRLAIQNIIGSYNPESRQRIMLCAHWDSRPWADQDENPGNHHQPVLAANDGASGAGILLEVARQLGRMKPGIGVDIILFDAEDGGVPQFEKRAHDETTWCLGSQYWARNPHRPNYRARYGILLDMVGAEGARFGREFFSVQCAPSIVDRVWQAASRLGYGRWFVDVSTPPLTDDHYFINQLGNIPCVDIVDYDQSRNNGFFDYWHTADDDMSHISLATLRAVGETVLAVVMSE